MHQSPITTHSMLGDDDVVGLLVGGLDGGISPVGAFVGGRVGFFVGPLVGESDGFAVGASVEDGVGFLVGPLVGASVGFVVVEYIMGITFQIPGEVLSPVAIHAFSHPPLFGISLRKTRERQITKAERNAST